MIKTKRTRTDRRTETTTVRLAPRTAWMIEVAARIQRRSVSSFISVASEERAAATEFRDGTTVETSMHATWHPDPVERLARLAQLDRSLISFDEEQLLSQAGKLMRSTDTGLRLACSSASEELDDLCQSGAHTLDANTLASLKALSVMLKSARDGSVEARNGA